MKIKGKKFFVFITVILFAAIMLFMSPRIMKTLSKSAVFRYVQNSQTVITDIANDVINGEIKTPYQHEKYRVQYFRSAKKPVVEFNGYGFGIAPSGYYTGFYYSPEDIPIRFNGSGTAMKPHKKGWVYHEGGDNHGYTEKICDNWYWFEFYF